MTPTSIRAGILIALLFVSTSIFCQTAGSITGNWKSEIKDKPLAMEIYMAADNAYYGKVINDSSSPSQNGRITLKKLEYDIPSQTFKGTMRPPDADIELAVTVAIIDKDRLKLTAKKMLITRTVYLTRIK